MKTQPQKQTLVAALLLSSAFALSVEDAGACGGLFCANSSPVNQAAERIIFARNDDGTLSSVIEIQYEGPAHEFAWLLPVPHGEVEVSVSSKQALDALQQASNPVYNLQTTVTDCAAQRGATAAASGFAPGMGASGPVGGAVQVVASGVAGPYDYVQIAVEEDTGDPADVALDWLEANEYDVPDLGPDVLRPYLAQGMDLLAFRLSKGADSGSVRPVFLRYAGGEPVIPIQPTAVAAQPDMGIMVWVLGEHRAIPENYLHLELNEAKIDWFNPQGTYDAVVIAAADEAGGQGFVTEQSGPASDFSETIHPTWKRDQWEDVRRGNYGSLQDFFRALFAFAQAPVGPNVSGLPPSFPGAEQYDGVLEVLSNPDVLPLREGATPEQFNACPDCYFHVDVPVRNDAYPSTEYIPGEDPLDGMDIVAFLDAFEEAVIVPLERTQALFDTIETVTRFYTTLSPEEMTVDPMFDFNPDLGPVSNTHTASQLLSCDTSEWTIELPQGLRIQGNGRTWPISVDDDLPTNFRISQLGTSGKAEVLDDNQRAIISGLIDLGVGSEGPVGANATDTGGVPIETNPKGSSGGFCSVAHGERRGDAPPLMAVALALLLGLTQRRRMSPSR